MSNSCNTGVITDYSLCQRLIVMMNNPFEGIVAVDQKGDIFYINKFFLDLLNVSEKQVIGQNINDVCPQCKLVETLKQGYSDWGDKLVINGKEVLTARFPIKDGGRLLGAMIKTVFPDLTIAKSVADKLTSSAKNMVGSNPSLCTCMDIVGETPSMLYVKKLARRAARTSSTLLITGDSGTGKEVVAQAIHMRSVRREFPYITVNCGAIPENLLESELFGYAPGAFTGAKKGGNLGKFELANGGTILLDEIGDMPLYMQVKILRVLQEKEVWPIGANIPTKLDVRVMASTNKDLKELVKERRFREDLYYRLNVLAIHMPPLRERIDDLPALVGTLLKRINKRIGSDAKGVTDESFAIMKHYSWPGNVRQLENILEQAVNWNEDSIIDIRNIPDKFWEKENENRFHLFNKQTLDYHNYVGETEKELIIEALTKTNGNKSKAAKMLNMPRSVLYKKLDRLNIHAMG